MSEFDQWADNALVTITAGSPESVGMDALAWNMGFGTSTVWQLANLAVYIPFVVNAPFTADKMMVYNGTAVAGNIDVGIYDDQQHRLVSIGSTAQAGTSVVQAFDIADTVLLPGVYYAAIAKNTASGALRGWPAGAVGVPGSAGVLNQATAFPLPATATFAACSHTFVPFFSITGRVLI